MKIQTKYEIGQHIWIAYEHNGEIHIYDDYIVNIVVDENKKIKFCSKLSYEEFEENEIILYEDKEKLLLKIEELMEQIRANEN